MEIKSFYGFKNNQFQAFNSKGKRLVITSLKIAPLLVIRVKHKEKDGYWAYQVALDKGFKRKILREIKIQNQPELKKGAKINPMDIFKAGDLIKVSGLSKGKGFSGVVKRFGFSGGPKTHGQSDRLRAPGSIGQGTSPGRVWKGKKMPGRMGGNLKTIKGLKVFKISEDNRELWIRGVIPGNRGGLVKISKLN